MKADFNDLRAKAAYMDEVIPIYTMIPRPNEPGFLEQTPGKVGALPDTRYTKMPALQLVPLVLSERLPTLAVKKHDMSPHACGQSKTKILRRPRIIIGFVTCHFK